MFSDSFHIGLMFSDFFYRKMLQALWVRWLWRGSLAKEIMYASYVGEGVAQKHTCVYKGRRALLCFVHVAQKMKFSIKNFFSDWPNAQETADLILFTGKILNGKLHFLCSGILHGRTLIVTLTHVVPMFPCNTPWNHKKTLRFPGDFRGYY